MFHRRFVSTSSSLPFLLHRCWYPNDGTAAGGGGGGGAFAPAINYHSIRSYGSATGVKSAGGGGGQVSGSNAGPFYLLPDAAAITIPEDCWVVEAVRGSGPGGQGVNSSSNRAELRVDLDVWLEMSRDACPVLFDPANFECSAFSEAPSAAQSVDAVVRAEVEARAAQTPARAREVARERHDTLYVSEGGHAVPGPDGPFTLLTPLLCDRLIRRAADNHSSFEVTQWYVSTGDADGAARRQGDDADGADELEGADEPASSVDHSGVESPSSSVREAQCDPRTDPDPVDGDKNAEVGTSSAAAHTSRTGGGSGSGGTGSLGRSSVQYAVTKHNTLIVDSHDARSLRENTDECMRRVRVALHEASYRPPPAAAPQKANQHVIRKAIQQRQMRSNRNKLGRSLSRGARVSSTKW